MHSVNRLSGQHSTRREGKNMVQSDPRTLAQEQGQTAVRRELQIVNPDPKYSRVKLIEPTNLGYIYVAAEVNPRLAPFGRIGRQKADLLAQLRAIARPLEQLDSVEKVTIFDAIAFPPPTSYVREHLDTIRVPRYDVVVLIETRSILAAREVQASPAYQALIDALQSAARQMYVITARNAKRISDVDKTRPGVYLFNYFVGDDPDVVLQLWDYLAGWYTEETGLDNSTLLAPVDGERKDYVAINNARWDSSLPGIALGQLTKPTFRSYVQANLDANHVGAMPVLYRAVNIPGQPISPARPRPWVIGAIAVGAVALGVTIALSRRQRPKR
jgi:hypothetical protein